MGKSGILLLFSAFILFGIGVLMVFNTTAAEVIDRSLDVDTHLAVKKQLLYFVFGLMMGGILLKIGYREILARTPILFLLTIFLLILVFIPKIGQTINGARRWIGLFGFTFQPSEMAKYVLPLYCLFKINSLPKEMSFKQFIFLISIFIVPVGLILLEPDNGTTLFIFVTFIIIFFLTRIPWTYWALPLFCLALIGGLVGYNMPHVQDRIRVYLHPELDLRGKGHQPYQSKIAAGSGKLWGKGLGESMQKMNYLPEARSDYIAAIFAEEFGFVGICALISLYMLLTYAGLKIAFQVKDAFSFHVASILAFILSFQAFLNLGVVSGLLPSKGITLPFFSQGGTSLVMNICVLAILISIHRESKKGLVLASETEHSD
jgi:cell division protein FtsW